MGGAEALLPYRSPLITAGLQMAASSSVAAWNLEAVGGEEEEEEEELIW